MAKILIVDDSKTMRLILGKMLKEMGHEIVAEAANGLEGYAHYAKYRPDLVTMDITMGVMDGVAAVKKIIADFPDAKIVMVSAYGHAKMVEKAIASGAKHFLVKPLDAGRAKTTIEEVLADKVSAESDLEQIGSKAFTIVKSGSKYIIRLASKISQEEIGDLQRDITNLKNIEKHKIVLYIPDDANYISYVIEKLRATVKRLIRIGAQVKIDTASPDLRRQLIPD